MVPYKLNLKEAESLLLHFPLTKHPNSGMWYILFVALSPYTALRLTAHLYLSASFTYTGPISYLCAFILMGMLLNAFPLSPP